MYKTFHKHLKALHKFHVGMYKQHAAAFDEGRGQHHQHMAKFHQEMGESCESLMNEVAEMAQTNDGGEMSDAAFAQFMKRFGGVTAPDTVHGVLPTPPVSLVPRHGQLDRSALEKSDGPAGLEHFFK